MNTIPPSDDQQREQLVKAKPFLYAIMEPNGTAWIDEGCVSDSPALIADNLDEGQSIVPLYRAAGVNIDVELHNALLMVDHNLEAARRLEAEVKSLEHFRDISDEWFAICKMLGCQHSDDLRSAVVKLIDERDSLRAPAVPAPGALAGLAGKGEM
jgi:hypothetical protein